MREERGETRVENVMLQFTFILSIDFEGSLRAMMCENRKNTVTVCKALSTKAHIYCGGNYVIFAEHVLVRFCTVTFARHLQRNNAFIAGGNSVIFLTKVLLPCLCTLPF